MTSKERVLAALAHKEPDRVPVDFGASAVTGIHAKMVIALRERYGLERRPVKVHEPYQMLGLVEEDLKQALGLDVDGVFPPETMFGYRNEGWTPWRLDDGTEVLMSARFQTVMAGLMIAPVTGNPMEVAAETHGEVRALGAGDVDDGGIAHDVGDTLCDLVHPIVIGGHAFDHELRRDADHVAVADV